jgi:hypothetical protein
VRDSCPVCRAQADINKDGVFEPHWDGMDRVCVMSGSKGIWDERSTRPAVKGRSDGKCEYCGRRATEMHHRIGRGVGGPWCPANILHLCSEDHVRVTLNPAWAKSLGLSVESYDEPAEVPVSRKDGSQFQPTNEVTP